MIQGFKNFIMKGNVIDLAVAVVMASAFGLVVTAIVEGLITPLIGKLFNANGMAEMQWEGFMYGRVIAAVINFLLVAAAVYFIIVVPMNKMIEARNRRLGIEEEEEAADPQIVLLTEIRDSLQARQ
ncbi:large conductance mechanosensitive channel protein MscL [Haematomicrobium sanguinis]|uniref:large conductance mechanosensitive channel protein MscL n=1 Tax=Haematomicrobium sanguinis TaxID=479106 RepID=UPI000478EFB5|nr:large conductance mechanosensitive channel protein MscL [Haematomicrobium sanguinis]